MAVVSLVEQVIAAGIAAEATAGPCPFPVGSRARCKVAVLEDGQTLPEFARKGGIVVDAHIAPGRSYWRAVVQLADGRSSRFDDGDLDRRFGPRVRRC